jgi:hypothetical protein
MTLACVLVSSRGLVALTITEIAYHPRGGPPALEFIEVFNETAEPVDLSGHRFARGVSFVFPSGTLLEARSYLVVCSDEDAIRTTHGITNVLGNWSVTTALDNGGETIELVNAASARLARVDYNDRGRWPAGADGTGFTLEIRDPYESMDDPRNWRVSSRSGGSPGRASPLSNLREQQVRINEALTLPANGDRRWIELHNLGTGIVDLGGFSVSRDRLNLTASGLTPDVLIPPRGFLVLEEFELGFDLQPNSEGEIFVALSTPDGDHIVDAYTFRPTIEGRSEARVPDGGDFFVVAAEPTPGGGHREHRDVVINEIHYHPPVGDQERDSGVLQEYVELHNRGQEIVDLGGWRFARGLRYEFPINTRLEPGAYLVVTSNPDGIGQRYGLDRALVFGPDNDEGRAAFGRLSNGGERVRLVDELGNLVDQVRYFDGGEWPRWADGGGSSLELIDPSADNGLAQAWDASDDSGEAPATLFSYRGQVNTVGEHELHLALTGAGIAQVDDIEMTRVSTELEVLTQFMGLDDTWRVLPGRSEPAADWREIDFDDGAWRQDPAPIGFGIGDESTVLVDMRGNYRSVYFRREITLENPGGAAGLFLEVHYDDGFAAHVNGVEVVRENLDANALHSDVATASTGDGAVARVDLSVRFPGLLVSGANIVAIQVHNVDVSSRDFRFAARLVDARPVETRGPNVVRDGDFESAESLEIRPWPAASSNGSWVFEGTHIRSGRSEIDPIAGGASLKIVATGRGDNKVNRIETSDDGLDPLEPGALYDVSFRARAIIGAPVLLTHGVYRGGEDPDYAAAHRLAISATSGTPGAINSVTRRQIARHGAANLGPLITNVRHVPAVPVAGQGVTVHAEIVDATGIASAEVRYRTRRPAEGSFDVAILEDEDGDGVFTAVLPGQSSGINVLFWIVATDNAGQHGRFPLDRLDRTHPLVLDPANPSINDHGYVVYRSDEPAAPGRPGYRFWMHEAHEQYLDARRLLSNDAVSGTFIFDDRQSYHGVDLRFSGSPFARQKWTESYRVRMPDDHKLWGRIGKFNLEDHQGDGALDGRERVANHLLRHNTGPARVPYQEHWLVSFEVNDRVSAVRDHVELPSREYLGRWYGDDDDGPFFELDSRHDINDAGDQENFRDARVLYPPVGDATHGEDAEFYRHFFNPRGGSSLDDQTDLTRVIELCRVFDPAQTDNESFDASIENHIDVEQFLRVFAVRLNTDDRDSWGGRRGKNYYFYRPRVEARWALVPWDMELTFDDPRSFSPPPLTATERPEYDNVFSEVKRLLNRPWIQRRYYSILAEMIDSHFDPDFLEDYLDGLAAAGVRRTDVGRTGGFIDQRRTRLVEATRGVRSDVVPFSGEVIAIDGPRVMVSGQAPIEVRSIRTLIDGAEPETAYGPPLAEFSNRDVLGWSYTATLPKGDHMLEFLAFGIHDDLIDQIRLNVRVSTATFLRGDVDGSGRLNISDAVLVALHLGGRIAVTCLDALDSDDSGVVDITDVVFTLSYLFLVGEAPRAPFPSVGLDPTADALNCDAAP